MLNLLYRIGTAYLLLLVAMPAVHAREFDAVINWSKRVELSTPVSGVVKNVFANPGDRVKKGDKLVKLDPRGFKANVEMAKANVTSQQALRDEAKREMERAQELYDRTVLSDHDLQTAKIGFATATAELKTAEATLVETQLELEYSTVNAPFDAVVISRHVEIGQTVVAELKPTVIIVVADAEHIIARVQIEQAALTKLNPGQNAEVTVQGKTFAGKIKYIGLEPLDKEGKTYSLDVEFAAGDTILRAGQKAKVNIP